MRSEFGVVEADADVLGNSGAVFLVNLQEVLHHSLLNVLAALAQVAGNVLNQVISVSLAEHLSEKSSRLLVVVIGVVVLVVVSADQSINLELRPFVALVLGGAAQAVGFVVGSSSLVSVHSHGPISLIVVHSSSVWAIDGDLVVVGTKSVSVSIRVREESSLEHSVVGGLDSGNQVGGSESRLLSLGEVVLGVLVESHFSDWDQRVVAMRPDLGDIKDIESVVQSFLLRHDLRIESPRGEAALGNAVKEVLGGVVLISSRKFSSFLGAQVLDTLVSLEMILHEESLTLSVDPSVGVGAVSVHESVSVWGASIGEQNRDLVKSFRAVRPEVPGSVGVLHVGQGVLLLGVDEVWELDGVLDEEHRGVVAHHIVNSLLSVEFDGKSSWISISVSAAFLSSHGGESQEKRGFLSNGVQELGLGESTSKYW